MVLELYTDASLKTFSNGRTFACAGAIAPQFSMCKYEVLPDTTNNRAELTAVFAGIMLANNIRQLHPEVSEIYLYSDSKFAVCGLTEWIDRWIEEQDTEDGTLYGSGKSPVKNQELFAMILVYLVENKLRINLRHIKGHVNYENENELYKANTKFQKINGYLLSPDDILVKTTYNNLVDVETRRRVELVNPASYPYIPPLGIIPVGKTIPREYKEYCIGGKEYKR